MILSPWLYSSLRSPVPSLPLGGCVGRFSTRSLGASVTHVRLNQPARRSPSCQQLRRCARACKSDADRINKLSTFPTWKWKSTSRPFKWTGSLPTNMEVDRGLTQGFHDRHAANLGPNPHCPRLPPPPTPTCRCQLLSVVFQPWCMCVCVCVFVWG